MYKLATLFLTLFTYLNSTLMPLDLEPIEPFLNIKTAWNVPNLPFGPFQNIDMRFEEIRLIL